MSLYAEIQEEIRQNIQNILTNKCPLSGRKLFYPISAVREQAEIDVREALREEKRIKVNYVGTESNQNGAKITIRYVIIGDFIVFELEKRLDELSAKVDDEAKKLSDLTLEFANVEGKLTTVETDITTLKADVASAKSDILINHDDIAEIDGKIAGQGQLVACHSMNAGVNGGNPDFVKQWTPIPINKILRKSGYLNPDGVAFLSGNRIRIPAGSYKIIGRVFGCGVIRFQSAISINNTIVAVGESIGSSKNAFTAGLTLCQVSEVSTEVDLSVEGMIALEGIYSHLHEFSASLGVAVFGSDANLQVPILPGAEEIYSSITINRVPS